MPQRRRNFTTDIEGKIFVRKNAHAFFSGQGLCPCRGPAARRWSCIARNSFYKKTREEQTALKSGSSPLALLSFPKLLTPLHKSQRLLVDLTSDVDSRFFMAEKCARIFLGSRTVSLSRSSGETLVVHSTKSSLKENARGANRFEKRFFSPRAPLFP